MEADRHGADGSIDALYGDCLYHTGLDENDGFEKSEDQARFGNNTK